MNIKRAQYYLNVSMVSFVQWNLFHKMAFTTQNTYRFWCTNITIKSCKHKFLSNISVEETHINVDIVFGF